MRVPVSSKQNIWVDSEKVDDADLTLEQNYNNQVQTGIINNHFGTGILPEVLEQNIIFDSLLAVGLLDGKAIDPQSQPLDVNLGNQLEVEVTGSACAGKRALKIVVIGLDFENNLQYDRFTFHKNETQISSKHYSKVLKILFNDFIGDPVQSLNLAGRIIIKDVKSFTLSRDCIMVAQDVEPNLFFRDFFVAAGNTLSAVLTAALPNYNIDTLEITTGYNQLRGISENDVSSQIGQKFLATTNNIQKISLLLAVSNTVDAFDLQWTGDLIVSIYQLQSSLICPTDITPELAIDFDPSNIPLAQLSLNFSSLKDAGVELDNIPQPVDFIFSNTPIGGGNIITPGSFYVVTIKRAGSADKCTIQVTTGSNRLENSRITIFNGSIWVDIPEEDLWFQVWTDAAKVADGQAYDAGHGIAIPKTNFDVTTGTTIDYVLDGVQFVRNDVYYALTKAVTQESDPIQDERTGNPILSHKQFVPDVSLINSSELLTLEEVADLLLLGTISDKNIKSFSAGSANILSKFHHFSMIGNQCILKVIDDPLDGYRYDLTVQNLVTELTGSAGVTNSNGLINARIYTNQADTITSYRIANTELLTMVYGDLNGDGIVDEQDLLELSDLIGSDLNFVPTQDEYVTLTTFFKNDVSLTWEITDGITTFASGIDGILTVNPSDGTRAIFNSISATFTSIISINTLNLVITGSSNPGNNGTFQISGLIDNNNINIKKRYFTSDIILKILRADINGDMTVDSSIDGYLITNYVNKVAPFPDPTSPGNRVGTTFTAIRFTLEEFIDRADDYPSTSVSRADLIHPLPEILLDGYNDGFSVYGRDLKNSPVPFVITKQLNWFDYLVNATSNPKSVPVSFNYQSGFVDNSCSIDIAKDDIYPLPPPFDPGRNDIFIPNNLIVNDGGQLVRPDGYFYKVDFEIGSVVFEIPAISFTTEKQINIFTDFVADFNGNGTTRLGYKAMRFADCSTVQTSAITNNQVRFSVSIQAFSPEINGNDIVNISGPIVDGRIGVFMDYDTGLLSLNFTNLFEDPVLQTLSTKIQIIVMLKKAGFNNQSVQIDSDKTRNLLGL